MYSGLLKKKLVYLAIGGHLLILLVLFLLFFLGGFDAAELGFVFYTYLPIAVLYFSLGIIFIKGNRYLPIGDLVDKSKQLFYYSLFIAFFAVQVLLILLKGIFSLIDVNLLCSILCLLECGKAIFGAIVLSKLLNQK